MNQHYVTQHYLNNFAERVGKKRVLSCYDKKTGKQFRAQVRKVACGEGFYDLPVADKAILTCDPSLKRIEDSFHKVLDGILARGGLEGLDEDSRAAVAQFVALQMFRTPAHRNSYKSIFDYFANLFPALKEGANGREATEDHLDFLTSDLRPFVALLLRLKLILWHNLSVRSLWTSDNPVWRYNHLPSPGPMHSNLGLISRGIEVHLPLSPDYMLMMGDPEVFGHEASYGELDAENVTFENCGQVINSTRFLFSQNGEFDLAERYLEEHSEYKDPSRGLITIQG